MHLKLEARVVALTIMSGCATGLNSVQERAYRAMESADVLDVEKKTDVGAALGLLPSGLFLCQITRVGVVNLLFWPLSILWDPVSG